MVKKLCLCAILIGVILEVKADGTLVKCGVPTSDTAGSKYATKDPSIKTYMEIKEHGVSFSDIGRTREDFEYRDRRVVHGQVASSTAQFPWIAEISLKKPEAFGEDESYSLQYCGGCILNEYYVLTAAHCLEEYSKNFSNWISNIRVSVGEYDQVKTDPFEEQFDVAKAAIIKDEDQDIALLKIKPKSGRGIRFSKDVQPVCLPTPKTPYTENSKGVVGGWGKTYNPTDIDEATAPHLYIADVPLEIKGCRKNGYFCSHLHENGPGVCYGDSGGPLVQNINGRFTLLGVMHAVTSDDCRDKGSSHMYIDVQYHLDWILGKMKELASQ